ncbi:aspartate kinase [Aquimarina intermedia]|uniref:Aspartokinase n=1 Tax=Aquimarina intermedia TaxID=350814 RepID=A0A5S5C9Z4_9FLAO|nr:aspartate kinase [Aquimarina intermedia]TYP76164.1 aspartate kinase [Aquimarina intermedia]
MKVFKFGGASTKDAEGVKNVVKVLAMFNGEPLVIVISAMGKTTNAIELILKAYLDHDKVLATLIHDLKRYHIGIIDDLFEQNGNSVIAGIESLFEDMQMTLSRNKSTQYDFIYDQIIGYGELLSSTILSAYLNYSGYTNKWIDARELIKTDSVYRDAGVQWQETQDKINTLLTPDTCYLTQGFIASDANNFTTTLGREGSDYTASILAYCLGADNVTIWKDVPGVLNADPRVFETTRLLSHISYEEAIELAFYGASVIHPKTLQPLQRKEIPLYVKSFLKPNGSGTTVKKGAPLDPMVPCYIVKKNQILLSLSARDFSFIVEDNISELFNLLHTHQLKVDLIQNSAISFSVCLDNKFNSFEVLLQQLQAKFKVSYQKEVALYTIRHFDQDAITRLEQNKDILLKQLTKETYQMVAKQ